MGRVLVTGASGFIGQQLAAALVAHGDEVMCLVREKSWQPALEKLGARQIHGDVMQGDSVAAALAVSNAEVVYHVAGLTRAGSLAGYLAVNEVGVRNLAEACQTRTTPPVVVVVSSLSAGGPVTDAQRPRMEADSSRPVSDYGRSKRAGEVAAEEFASSVPITIVRPPIVIGPGDRMGLAMFRNIRRFRAFMVPERRSLFSIVYVTDLVAALIAAAECGERLPGVGEIGADLAGQGYYFAAADERVTLGQWGRLIGRSIRRPYAMAIPMPRAGLWSACAMGEVVGWMTKKPRYLNLDRGHEITGGHWICSAEKAKQQLGFACGADLPTRIRETADWYRGAGWL